jgi:molybdate transport system substrate-binding protein
MDNKQKFSKQIYRQTLLTVVCFFTAMTVNADTLNVAVASNFLHTLKSLSADFEEQSGHRLRISSASTGKLYMQIQHGAPFDVFLAADEKHPDLLTAEKKTEQSSALIYARGKLVFVSNITTTETCREALTSPALKRLSIANPKTAPYGVAAKQVMQKLELWTVLKPRLVMGENIAQALQYFATGNAQAGFVAGSMLNMGKEIDIECSWEIPADLYSPVDQKMVLLNRAKDKVSARAFMRYMQSAEARAIIGAAGYDVVQK